MASFPKFIPHRFALVTGERGVCSAHWYLYQDVCKDIPSDRYSTTVGIRELVVVLSLRI